MGGDYGPEVTIPASLDCLKNNPDLKLILVGNEAVIKQLLPQELVDYQDRLTIHHASQCVGMDESPSKALKNKKDSSMRVAINLVRDGHADACVSAG
ncbi:MAG: phosphate acyltransferase, partial [Methylococcaceae bacterium]|nr:phosphate acyltransferase [Methylococcaceae bacterium]